MDNEAPRKNRLILTVGLPRAGKDTWAMQQGFPIVNPDAIRLAMHGQRFYTPAEPLVWAMAQLMVDALFIAGHDTVIVNATNVTEKRRQAWTIPRAGIDIEYEVFTTDPKTCIQRAIDSDREDLIPVIKRMAEEWDICPRPWRL